MPRNSHYWLIKLLDFIGLMVDTVYMKKALQAAQHEVWVSRYERNESLPRQAARAFKTAYEVVRDNTAWGFLLFPHAITRNAPEGLWR
jgi:hypothetical protein